MAVDFDTMSDVEMQEWLAKGLGIMSYTYDANDNLTQSDQRFWDGNTYRKTYSYDAAANLTDETTWQRIN